MTDKPVLSSKLIRNSTSEFPIFTTQESDSSVEARYEDETIWLTQSLIAELLVLCLWTWVTVLCQDIGDTSVGSGGDTCGLRLSGEL